MSTGTGRHGFESTALPFVVDDELTELRAHLARANRHWEQLDGQVALMIVAGPDAYISPRWYPSKAQHGRVVPTWNYEVIHLHGTVEINDDPSWKRALVTDLTDHNELQVGDRERSETWSVSDAPDDFIDAQLKAERRGERADLAPFRRRLGRGACRRRVVRWLGTILPSSAAPRSR